MNDLTLNLSFIICIIVLIGMYYLQYLSRKNREAKERTDFFIYKVNSDETI